MTRSIAYMVSRFPSTSQTFILNEILELEALGWDVALMPLLRSSDDVVHPGAADVVANAKFLRVASFECGLANLHWLVKRPRSYFKSVFLAFKLPGRHVRFIPKAIWSTFWAMMVALEVEKRQIKHVHAHWATFPAHAALVVSQLAKCTFSFTAHAHDIYANPYGLKEKIENALFVVTISEFNKQHLLKFSANDQISVVRCGVDTSKLFRGHRDHAASSTIRLLAVGSLEEKKGQKYLVEACAKLVADGHAIECRIVGDGPDRSRLRELIANLGVEESVTLAGPLASDAVADELSEADIFVMPSIVARNGMMEGIPVALMEAMASGIPVIASAISGIPELVTDGESGILVQAHDSEAIADAVKVLHGDQALCDKLSSNARARVVKYYDLRKNVSILSSKFEAAVTSP